MHADPILIRILEQIASRQHCCTHATASHSSAHRAPPWLCNVRALHTAQDAPFDTRIHVRALTFPSFRNSRGRTLRPPRRCARFECFTVSQPEWCAAGAAGARQRWTVRVHCHWYKPVRLPFQWQGSQAPHEARLSMQAGGRVDRAQRRQHQPCGDALQGHALVTRTRQRRLSSGFKYFGWRSCRPQAAKSNGALRKKVTARARGSRGCGESAVSRSPDLELEPELPRSTTSIRPHACTLQRHVRESVLLDVIASSRDIDESRERARARPGGATADRCAVCVPQCLGGTREILL